MGGKSSKGGRDSASLHAQQHSQLQQKIEQDLELKRPASRRVLSPLGNTGFSPAYALETLDENSVIVVRNSGDLEPENPHTSTKRRESSAESDDGAIVYVFNPDRVVSHRVSKRISVADESLVLERLSTDRHSHASAREIASKDEHYTMVNIASDVEWVKMCDASVIGRTGSSNMGQARALCQDEAHFEASSEGLVFGVFDGHGPDGHLIAALCAKELLSCVVDDQAFYLQQQDLKEAVKGGIASLQRRLDEIPPNRADVEFSGSTATVGLISPNGKVVVANVGDTRAIGARREPGSNKLSVVKLSDEHIFTVPEEVSRIEKCGGRVAPVTVEGRPIGPPRCWFGFEDADQPGLMVSRTLGDSIARRIGVNAECSVYDAEGLAFIIIASDGLWEVMTNEEAIGFVGGALVKPVPNLALSELLCMEAKRRWFNLESKCGDDISALVVVFK